MRTLTRLQVVTALVTATSIGALAGIGGFTFVYAKGGSYLTDDPAACVNCHVMREQFDGWVASSHRSVALCNDCHAPHQLIPKYVTKAINGWNHSVAFTTGNFPDPIRITQRNLELTSASDFPAVLDQRRGRIPQGRSPRLRMTLLDDGAAPGRGGWIAIGPDSVAELLVQSPIPLAATTVGVRAEGTCNVHVSSDRDQTTVVLGEVARRDVDLELPQVFSHHSFVCVLRVDTTSCPTGAEVALQGKPAP